MKFKVKKLSEHAVIPIRSDNGAAGFDLYAAEDVSISEDCRKLVKTNIAIQCPPGFYGKIEGRSGLAYKHGINILGGVIDENYSGDIGVIMHYTGKDKWCSPFMIRKGDRIAQIIFHRYYAPELEEVNDLDETTRGKNGFGSSGV